MKTPKGLRSIKHGVKPQESKSKARPLSMDPRLHLAFLKGQVGLKKGRKNLNESQEIRVIAKVKTLEAWQKATEVRNGVIIGRDAEGNYLVTGRVNRLDLPSIRRRPWVVSLKAAQRLRRGLHDSLSETNAYPDLLPTGVNPQGGEGVVVGVVDFGGDFVHRNFRHADGTTRFEAIWVQGLEKGQQNVFGYGRVFTTHEINAALKKKKPYASVKYYPDPGGKPTDGAHGTHVLDIAGGNGFGSGQPGFAPHASLVFVDLTSEALPDAGSPETVGKSFGDSVQLLEALKFIFDQAGDRPCVINVSLALHCGPHDGSTLVEQGMDALIKEKSNRAIVVAAANAFTDQIHSSGKISPAKGLSLTWEFGHDYQPGEMEIWMPGKARVAVELIAPDGSSMGFVEPGENRQFTENGQIFVFMSNRLKDPNNGDNCIGLFISDTFKAGTWKVNLQVRGKKSVPFHAWIERLDGSQSTFGAMATPDGTLGSISTGRETVVVGAYDAHQPTTPIAYFSSAGPTRDGRKKPELSAPGMYVSAAWSSTGTKVIKKSGTSMAAPAVTGIIALMLAEALRRGKKLTSSKLRSLLRNHVRKHPPDPAEWHPQFGYGRISAASVTLQS